MSWFALRTILRDEAGEGEGDGGGDGPAAEAAEPTDKEPTKPMAKEPAEQLGKPKTVGDLKAKTFEDRKREATKNTNEMLRAQREAKAAAKAEPKDEADDKPEPAAKDEPTEKAEKTAKAIEKAGGDAPDQKANETDKQYEARLVKALQDLRGAETQTKQQKARAEAAEQKAAQHEKELAQVRKILDRGKTDEETLDVIFEVTGKTLDDIVNGINEKRIPKPRDRPRVDPEMQAEIEAIKAENARLAKLAEDRDKKEQEQEQDRIYAQNLDKGAKYIRDNAAEFPLLQAIPWAARNIVNAAYQNGGDMGEPARKLQQSILEDFAPMLDHDDAWKLLDGKLSATAKEKLQKRYAAATAAAKPDVIKVPEHTRKPPSRVTTEVAVPEKARKGETAEERRARGTREMQKFLDAKAARG